MAPRTRYFLFAAALVVIVGVCTGLVAYYSGSLPGLTSRQAEFRYLPADASMVGYANVSGILNSPFSEQLRGLLPPGEERTKFQQETGVDIDEIDSVVIAMTGHVAPGASGVALVRGGFDQAKVEAAVAGHGAQVEVHRDVKMFVAPGEASADGKTHPAIAFLEPGLLAIGTRDQLRGVIDAAASGAGAADNADMMRAIAGIEREGNAWLVARTSTLAEHTDLPAALKTHAENLRWLSVGADVGSTVRAVVRVEAQSEQAASDLRSLVDGAVAAARLMGGKDTRLEGVLKSVQTSSSGSSVELQVTVPPDMLDFVHQLGAAHHAVPAQ
jgi:hypothetical protein